MTSDASTEYLSLTEIAEQLDASLGEVRRACLFRKLPLQGEHSSPVVAAEHLEEIGIAIAERRARVRRAVRKIDASTKLSVTEVAEHLDANINEVRRAFEIRELPLVEDDSLPVAATERLEEIGIAIGKRRAQARNSCTAGASTEYLSVDEVAVLLHADISEVRRVPKVLELHVVKDDSLPVVAAKHLNELGRAIAERRECTQYLSVTEVAEYLDASINEVRRAFSILELNLVEDDSLPVVAAKHLDELEIEIAQTRARKERRRRAARGEDGQVIVTIEGVEHRLNRDDAYRFFIELVSAIYPTKYAKFMREFDGPRRMARTEDSVPARSTIIVTLDGAEYRLAYRDADLLGSRLATAIHEAERR
ncbi:hypothetical protein [Rhodococcus sp. NPDC049939]|uniref:hypothetical protein n=1 Tax=Rhodococcus sp. NPDC049939 TaxID=3155511 RepID=UPI0033ECAB77